MTPLIHRALIDLGYTEAHIRTLARFYALKGGKGGSAVCKASKTTKTTIDNRGSQSISAYNKVLNLSHALFGGFTPSQVNRLLSVCEYHHIPLDGLTTLMHDLHRQSRLRGWVRTRDAVERLARAA